MQGSGRISAVIQTALYASASPFIGIAEGVRLLTTMVTTPGAVAGYLTGKLVSKVVAAGCQRLNKNRTIKNPIDAPRHVRRTLRVLQTAGAVTGSALVIMQALSHPVLMALYAVPLLATVAKRTFRQLMSCKKVYQAFRSYGTNETLKKNLLVPFESLYPNIYFDHLSKTGNFEDLFSLKKQASNGCKYVTGS
ncbi:hypothetical protein [Endozoicomonas sp. 8E]|uniref:hypothetical protein n=1 Tax=Endozoicomonas sp. 8E TaxID=3035692 RepID=UPI002938EB7E|nr:hypothetical protein [Endozoicomonas sp. 8E]WOG28198.1 hypothetical protein P6910_00690 [Endozoicomonas sp. 8E]